jgi:threonine/homoserine/homoserine lactone efflux protein
VSELLPPGPMLSAFVAASLVVALTPGPGVFYVVSRSLAQGRRSGLVSVLGLALGNLGNALAAALGLAALFAVSSLAFAVVKYAGAAWLIYIGVRLLLGGRSNAAIGSATPLATARVFRDALVVSLLNPKTTVFFAAFLPQFASTAAPLRQSVALGWLFVLIAIVTDGLYAIAAGSMARLLLRDGAGRIGRWLGGGLFIGLGLFTALAGSRAVK